MKRTARDEVMVNVDLNADKSSAASRRIGELIPTLKTLLSTRVMFDVMTNGVVVFRDETIAPLVKKVVARMRTLDGLGISAYFTHARSRYNFLQGPSDGNLTVVFPSELKKNVGNVTHFTGPSHLVIVALVTALIEQAENGVECSTLPAELAALFYPYAEKFTERISIHDKITGVKVPSFVFFRHMFTPLTRAHGFDSGENALVLSAKLPHEITDEEYSPMLLPALAVALACRESRNITDVFEMAWDAIKDMEEKKGDLFEFMNGNSAPENPEEEYLLRFVSYVTIQERINAKSAKGSKNNTAFRRCTVMDYYTMQVLSFQRQIASQYSLFSNIDEVRYMRMTSGSPEGLHARYDVICSLLSPFLGDFEKIDNIDGLWAFVTSAGTTSGVAIHKNYVELYRLTDYYLMSSDINHRYAFTTPAPLLAGLITEFSSHKDEHVVSCASHLILRIFLEAAMYNYRFSRKIRHESLDFFRGKHILSFLNFLPYYILHLDKKTPSSDSRAMWTQAIVTLNRYAMNNQLHDIIRLFSLFVSMPTNEKPYLVPIQLFSDEVELPTNGVHYVIPNEFGLGILIDEIRKFLDRKDYAAAASLVKSINLPVIDRRRILASNKNYHSHHEAILTRTSCMSYCSVPQVPTYLGSQQPSIRSFPDFLAAFFHIVIWEGTNCSLNICPFKCYSLPTAAESATFPSYQQNDEIVKYGEFITCDELLDFSGATFNLIQQLHLHARRDLVRNVSMEEE